jgi:hypothetical protein
MAGGTLAPERTPTVRIWAAWALILVVAHFDADASVPFDRAPDRPAQAAWAYVQWLAPGAWDWTAADALGFTFHTPGSRPVALGPTIDDDPAALQAANEACEVVSFNVYRRDVAPETWNPGPPGQAGRRLPNLRRVGGEQPPPGRRPLVSVRRRAPHRPWPVSASSRSTNPDSTSKPFSMAAGVVMSTPAFFSTFTG